MTQNLLVERLKYAKRELTALKTAHTRGLGMLRVYRRSVDLLSPSSAGYYRVTITATFSSLFAPFPYAQGVLGPVPSNIVILQQEEFEYSSDGKGFTSVISGYFFNGSIPIEYEILSLAPISNLNTQWESA